MKNYYDDRKYQHIVYDILENDEFKSMGNILHHESNRFDHSIRVSYYSYRLAKALKLDYEKIARAALLHDFFLENNQELSKKKKIKLILKHPQYALENAKKYFDLSSLEEDIILSHMFPIGTHIPKYFESWMVDFIDDIVSIYEKTTVVRKQLSTATCFLVMVLINYLK